MTFSEGGRFEGGRVKRHGRGGTAVAGGGLVGIIALAIFLFTGQDVSGILGAGDGGGAGQPVGEVGECTAEQANADPLCRYSATLEALDVYWAATVPAGTAFAPPTGNEFTDGVATGCGQASASTGPFYCPPDQGIYLDVTFFDLLRQQLGAQGGPLAEMYIYAHEYGHHVQNLTGVFDAADRSGAGAESDSVRVELQADCYAGMWVGDAATRQDPETGVTYLEPPTTDELAQALDAAATVGDDHIQQQSGGVNPDTWTHGSSEQRQRWFTTGYEQGSLAACDTFAASEL